MLGQLCGPASCAPGLLLSRAQGACRICGTLRLWSRPVAPHGTISAYGVWGMSGRASPAWGRPDTPPTSASRMRPYGRIRAPTIHVRHAHQGIAYAASSRPPPNPSPAAMTRGGRPAAAGGTCSCAPGRDPAMLGRADGAGRGGAGRGGAGVGVGGAGGAAGAGGGRGPLRRPAPCAGPPEAGMREGGLRGGSDGGDTGD